VAGATACAAAARALPARPYGAPPPVQARRATPSLFLRLRPVRGERGRARPRGRKQVGHGPHVSELAQHLVRHLRARRLVLRHERLQHLRAVAPRARLSAPGAPRPGADAGAPPRPRRCAP